MKNQFVRVDRAEYPLNRRLKVVLENLNCTDKVAIMEIDDSFTNGRQIVDTYQFPEELGINTLFFKGKKGKQVDYLAILAPFKKKVVTKTIKKNLGYRDLEFLDKNEAEQITHQEFGAFSPFGIPSDWKILTSEDITNMPELIIGSGERRLTLKIEGKLLLELSNISVVPQNMDYIS